MISGDWNVMIWAMIPIVAIVGGIVVALVGTVHKARIRELEIRERIAMIERGLVPAPENDPHGFDRAMDRLERASQFRGVYRANTPGRHRRAGIILMGVGFGMMVLLGFTEGASGQALGVGGFLVVLGLAFLVSGLFDRNQAADMMPGVESSAPKQTPPSK
jgi:hypothetical protein